MSRLVELLGVLAEDNTSYIPGLSLCGAETKLVVDFAVAGLLEVHQILDGVGSGLWPGRVDLKAPIVLDEFKLAAGISFLLSKHMIIK